MNRTLTSSKPKRRRPHSKMWLATPQRIGPELHGQPVIDERPRAERRRIARKIVKGYEPQQSHTGITKNQGKRHYGPGPREIGRYAGRGLS